MHLLAQACTKLCGHHAASLASFNFCFDVSIRLHCDVQEAQWDSWASWPGPLSLGPVRKL